MKKLNQSYEEATATSFIYIYISNGKLAKWEGGRIWSWLESWEEVKPERSYGEGVGTDLMVAGHIWEQSMLDRLSKNRVASEGGEIRAPFIP